MTHPHLTTPDQRQQTIKELDARIAAWAVVLKQLRESQEKKDNGNGK